MVRPCARLVPAFIAAVAVAAAARAQEVVTAAKQSSAPGTVIEAESLAQDAKASAGPVTVQNMQPFGVQWGGGAQLFWRPPAPVDEPSRNWPHLTTSLSAPADGEYSIVLYYTVAPDFGNFRVFLNGEPARDVSGFAPAVGLRRLELAKTHLQAGSQQLVLTVFSKEPSATDYFVGLDRFELRRVRTGGSASLTPKPLVFQKGDEDLTFHLDAGTFELAWDIECRGTPAATEIEVYRAGSRVPCTTPRFGAHDTGSMTCSSEPGDFQLEVEKPSLETWGDDFARVEACQEGWNWRITIRPQ